MKRILFILLLCLPAFSLSAQKYDGEFVKPTFGVSFTKEARNLIIGEDIYFGATITLKSSAIDTYAEDRVKVLVKDADGLVVFRKTIYGYLYLFSSGQVQVGKPRFTQLVLYPNTDGTYDGEINLNGL